MARSYPGSGIHPSHARHRHRPAGASSTARTPPSATGSASGSPRRATRPRTTCRSRSTARRCSPGRKELAGRGETVAGYPREYGGDDDLGGYISGFETLGFGDLSPAREGRRAVRPLRRRGAAPRHGAPPRALPGRHRLARAAGLLRDDRGRPRLRRPAPAHDRDLRRRRRRSSSIDTPDDDAHKMWIGNAARDGRMAAVFAQLIVGGEERGVHALLVPIARRAAARVLDGVRIEDCGPKLGPRRRRQRQALVRRRARAARGAAGPLRDGLRGRAPTTPTSRARPSASSRCSAR